MTPTPDTPFARDLDALRLALLSMGGHVEAAIHLAARALDLRDEELAAQVMADDAAIDAAEAVINAQVVQLLARHQPQDQDLRAAVSVIKMAGDLERLGDYAKNMAKRVPVLSHAPAIPGAGSALRRQARLVGQMLTHMLDGFARDDGDLARHVIACDVEVDDMTNALFREFVSYMVEDPRHITPCLHYLFIAKNLERMGDLVTHGAESIIFATEGQIVRDRVKGSSTATIAALQEPAHV